MCVHAKWLQLCPTLCNPRNCSSQVPLSKGFSRHKYWSRLPCPSPEDLPDPGIESTYPTLQVDSLLLSHQERPLYYINIINIRYIRDVSEKASHSSTLSWKIPWMEEPGGPQSMGSLRVRQDWETSLSLFTFMHWRRKWQPTPVFLPGESQGRGSLVGCRLWGHTEPDTTEAT